MMPEIVAQEGLSLKRIHRNHPFWKSPGRVLFCKRERSKMVDFSKIFDPNNLAAVLVVAGLGFLLLAIVGEIQGKVKVPPERQKLAGGIGVVLLVAGLVLYTTRTSQPTIANVVATPSVVPTASPMPTKTTPIAVNAATPDTMLLLDTARSWPIVVNDRFVDNQNYGWDLGGWDWETGWDKKTIEGGKYRWEWESKVGVWYRWVYPGKVDAIKDFYLSVEGKTVKGSSESQYGVVIRGDSQRFYRVGIIGDKYFYFEVVTDSYLDLVRKREISANGPGRENRLEVIANGSHFLFYVNAKYIAESDDDQIKIGYVGLSTGLAHKGEQAIFEFDNFELRRKP